MRKRSLFMPRCPARVNPIIRHPDERRATLDGTWDFRLDPTDEGIDLGWHQDPSALQDRVRVPGCWQGQGFGHDGTDRIWDFQLDARVFKATYAGTGWYGRTFRIPLGWDGLRTWLDFGGVHPSADVWLNGTKLGSHSGPFLPFAFDITDRLRPDADNFLCVRVHEKDRWMGLAYNWQGKWSGLYRSVEMTATGGCWLDELAFAGDVDARCLRVRAGVGGTDEALSEAQLRIVLRSPDGYEAAQACCKVGRGSQRRISVPVISPLAWSPEEPNLYQVDALLLRDGEVLDASSERVGFVKLSTRRKHFLINDQPYYMRGSGDFAVNPETGSPDTNRQRWRRKLAALREYGYNHVRCQSHVPTPEYLDAADEVGLLVQSEMGMLGAWSGMSPWHRYAWPEPSAQYRQKLKWQWDRTVMRDVNHPSAAIYCMSNELGKETLYPRTAWRCYRSTKRIKPWALVIWTDGGYNPTLPGDFVNAEAKTDRECRGPVIQHEYRWWSSYPDVRIKGKYTGAMRPYAIQFAETVARSRGLFHLLPTMAQNSQRLQYLEARGKMEKVRRDHPTLAGICHFTAMDSGFSPQGILDEFYERKWVDAATWLRTWGDVVLLIDRDFDDRVLSGRELLNCTILVSDFSHPPLKRPKLRWELLGRGRKLASGRLGFAHRPFRTQRMGRISATIPDARKPYLAKLRAILNEGARSYVNEWDFWVFPRRTGVPTAALYHSGMRTWLRSLSNATSVSASDLDSARAPRVVLSDEMDQALMRYIKRGGRVVLAATEDLLKPFHPKLGLDVGRYFFLPPANYPPFEDGHSGTIVAEHPMLGDLPHWGFADLQLYRPIAESPPIDLLALGGSSVKPVIRALSTYFVGHPLAYLAEFSLGRGGMIITALDLNQSWPEGRYILSSILRYASGRSFHPANRLRPKVPALAEMNDDDGKAGRNTTGKRQG